MMDRSCRICKYSYAGGYADNGPLCCGKMIETGVYSEVYGCMKKRRLNTTVPDGRQSPYCSDHRKEEAECGPSGKYFEPSLITVGICKLLTSDPLIVLSFILLIIVALTRG